MWSTYISDEVDCWRWFANTFVKKSSRIKSRCVSIECSGSQHFFFHIFRIGQFSVCQVYSFQVDPKRQQFRVFFKLFVIHFCETFFRCANLGMLGCQKKGLSNFEVHLVIWTLVRKNLIMLKSCLRENINISYNTLCAISEQLTTGYEIF
jgi:hypothetical protein